MEDTTKYKNPMLRVRYSQEELDKIATFAEDVYNVDRSEFVRLAVSYIMRNKPVLGKRYAPEGQSLTAMNN